MTRHVHDLEVFPNFHSAVFLDIDTGDIREFVICPWRNDSKEYIEFLESGIALIGFNNLNYDYPVLHWILSNKHKVMQGTAEYITAEIYEESGRIIDAEFSAIREWLVKIPQLDLFKIHHFDNKAKGTSLKQIEFAIKWSNLQDLPFDPHYVVKEEDIDSILKYNLNDVLATYEFYLASRKEINMRKDISKEFGIDAMNFNDTKIGEEIFVREIAKATGWDINSIRKMRTHRSSIQLGDVIMDKIKFTSNKLNEFLTDLKSKVVTKTKDSFGAIVNHKGFNYEFGLGGLHGCIDPGIYSSDDDYIIVDIDVNY